MSFPVIALVHLGCRVNQYENRRIREELEGLVTFVPFGEPADVTVINSCVVTRTAERETRQMVHRARRFSPEGILVLTGCYPAIHPDRAEEIEPGVFVFPQEQKNAIAGWIRDRFLVSGIGTSATSPEKAHMGRPSLVVQNGCDHACSYCIIPVARGPSLSRPEGEVLEEFLRMWETPVAEIVLSGINLGLWGRDLRPARKLPDLVRLLLEHTPENRRIRLGSVEPDRIDPDLVSLVPHPKLAGHLHIPLQGTTDGVLSAMGRTGTTETFLQLLESLRRRLPDIALGTDVITGFPAETEDLFGQGLSFLEQCRFAYMHVFPFSLRPGTPAAGMKTLPKQVVRDRAAQVREVARRHREGFLAGWTGRTVKVAVEQTEGTWFQGMADAYFPVRFSGPRPDGLVNVNLRSLGKEGFWGESCAAKIT